MGTISFTVSISGLDEDTLVVREFSGVETLSHADSIHGFEFSIAVASRQHDLTAQDVVDKTAELRIYQNGELSQRFCGIVCDFSQGDSGQHHTFYHLTLVPALTRLALRHNSRIFQNLNACEIIATLCDEMGINYYAFALSRECAQREFCVQYRESDLAFIERLSAEEGMSYSFTHEAGKHTVVFSDNSVLLPKLPEPVPYHNQAGGDAPHTYIRNLQTHTRIAPSDVELQDYSFKQPSYNHAHTAWGKQLQYQRDSYEHFDTPGRYKSASSGKAFSQHRLEYLRREAHTATGKSNHAPLRAGYRFSLSDHPDANMNRDWLVISVQHQGKQPQALEEAATTGQTTYHNEFKLLPANLTWRSNIVAKPQVDGPVIAKVVGPKGEEIHCDEYGRIKIHFTWDRYSHGDEHSSCWVRVSQAWAGGQYGLNAIPRIGHEVIVSFLNGDPDQPIVTGCVHNARLKTPYPLPEHKTKTVLRSNTHQGEGFNELSFEDQVDSEKIYLRGQRDMQAEIGNSQHWRVNYDNTTDIGHDEMLVVANDRTVTVEGAQSHSTSGDYANQIKGTRSDTTEQNWVNKVMGAIGINADGDITLKSASKLTLQVGGAFVVVDKSGVSINGTQVCVNSGGSPGSIPMPSSPAVLAAAASEGAAFLGDCPPLDGA